MQTINIGDTVRVLSTGDDHLDWAAGMVGEVVNVRLVQEYLYGRKHPDWLQAEYHSVTVRFDNSEVTVNDHEVEPVN